MGVVSLSVRKQMSYRASLSMQKTSSAFSTSWCTESVALYGSTTVSDTWSEDTMDNVSVLKTPASVGARALGMNDCTRANIPLQLGAFPAGM